MLYSDEVVLGNPLATSSRRNFQIVFFSFLEFGTVALSHEESWCCAMVEFSRVINSLAAGMSQMFAAIIKVFFNLNGIDISKSGVSLPGEGGTIRLFAKLAAFLQDGGAHKTTWHCRGDGASKFCLLCKNLFASKSNICDEDGSNLLRCDAIKKAELVPAESNDLRRAARYLAAHKGTMDPGRDADTQQALGLTGHPAP